MCFLDLFCNFTHQNAHGEAIYARKLQIVEYLPIFALTIAVIAFWLFFKPSFFLPMTSKNIVLLPNGKYSWVYEMSLYSNPTILLILLKIFFWIFTVMGVLLSLLNIGDSWYGWPEFLDFLKSWAIFMACALAFVTVGYYIYALLMGGKYCVLFEMNDEGVLHKQMPKQVKKAHLLAMLGMGIGAASGNVQGFATSAMARAKSQMYSSFKSVKSVEAYPSRNLIKVNSTLNYNQVYAADEDFEQVLHYILERVPQKAKIRL